MLIDSHVHISSFSDVESILENSKREGVKAIVAVGGNLELNKKTLKIAEKNPNYVFPGIGFHPSEILKDDIEKNLVFIKEKALDVVSIGEVGLDYSYSFAKSENIREKQREVYTDILTVARNSSLPVSIHSRSAYSDALDLLLEFGPDDAVFHYYDGPLHTLKEILDAGCYVSSTPAIEYSRGLRSVMKATPLEQILVETDSPVYLRSLRRRSEPADVLITVRELAKLKEQDLGEVIRVTGENALRLFDKIPL
jgi:TatD DNase family protein